MPTLAIGFKHTKVITGVPAELASYRGSPAPCRIGIASTSSFPARVSALVESKAVM
jgi:hypothetical protein